MTTTTHPEDLADVQAKVDVNLSVKIPLPEVTLHHVRVVVGLTAIDVVRYQNGTYTVREAGSSYVLAGKYHPDYDTALGVAETEAYRREQKRLFQRALTDALEDV